jgi:uncharacterized protein YceK
VRQALKYRYLKMCQSVKIAKAVVARLMLILLAVSSTGCATYRTISEGAAGGPKVFSGTRLDIKAVTGDEIGIKKFKTTPPSYPLADLPFSVVLDTIMIPLTFSAAASDLILGP